MKIQHSWILIIGLIFTFSAGTYLSAKDAVERGTFTAKDKAYYLTTDEFAFVRPGLKLEILDVTIPDDLQPEVWFTITDPEGMPLDRDGITTPGPVSTSFIMSYIPQGEEAYIAYTTRVQTSPITNESATQGSTDSGGTYQIVATGEYIYKFATVLPADYDVDATHTLGIYSRRDLRDFDLDRYVDNDLEHFIPSGNAEPVPRDIVKTETCNGRCHDPLALHGGSRREVGLCILCHNPPQGIDPDTGSLTDFKSMIHKIHSGADLLNPLIVIGYRQSEHDYSDVVFPAQINDCEICHTGGIPTKNFPLVADPPVVLSCNGKGKGQTTLSWKTPQRAQLRLDAPDGNIFMGGVNGKKQSSKTTGNWITDGRTVYLTDAVSGETIQELELNTTVLGCVGNAPGTFRGEAGAQHTNWLDHPSRRTCGSCHDDLNFETGEGHLGGAQADDNLCNICHVPDSGVEFDRSIRGAHKPLYKSAQFPGVVVEINEVTDTNPGDTPTVTFSLRSKNGKLSPRHIDRLRFTIVGPNEDFSFFAQETVENAVRRVGKYWAYTFETPLPEDAEGSFTVGFEARDIVPIDFGDEVSDERDNAENTTFAFAVTDDEAVPRRMVVDDVKCENCHSNREKHGGSRHNPQYCVTCHRPDFLSSGEPSSTIHFKYMIHKIHRGADLEKGFVVNRSRDRVVDFSDLKFPGDLRNCETCHVSGSNLLPLPDGLLATTTPQELWDPMLPTAAACLACHDGDAAAAHAFTNTAVFGEACANCHGEGKEFAVEKIHAR